MVLVPPSSNELSAFDSEMKIFLPEEGFPAPFISTVNTGQPTLFCYSKGKTTTVEALLGDIRLLSTKKRTSLSGQSYSYEKHLKKGTTAQVSALTGALSATETLGNWGSKHFSAMDHLNETVMKKGEALAQKMALNSIAQTTVPTSLNRRNWINPNANLLQDSLLRSRSRTDSEFTDWNELLDRIVVLFKEELNLRFRDKTIAITDDYINSILSDDYSDKNASNTFQKNISINTWNFQRILKS